MGKYNNIGGTDIDIDIDNNPQYDINLVDKDNIKFFDIVNSIENNINYQISNGHLDYKYYPKLGKGYGKKLKKALLKRFENRSDIDINIQVCMHFTEVNPYLHIRDNNDLQCCIIL